MASDDLDRAIVTYRSFGAAFDRPAAGPASPRALESGRDPAADAALQAELSAALAALEEETLKQGPGVLATVQSQLASLIQSRMLEDPPGDPQKLTAPPGASPFEVKFDEHDIFGWVGSVLTWWKQIRKEPWLTPSDTPEPIGNGRSMRLAMVADWGTGLYGAPVCSASIDADPRSFDLLLHLGDIYYSGTRKEVRSRFLDKWPSRAGAISRACNANHEMYTGGEGYFRDVLPAFGQPASYFALQNDHWLLVGLDSAYEDHDLAGAQADWLGRIVANAGGRRLVLFSHHQPFSLLDKQGPKLVGKLGALLADRKIFAWYWGHEHRCVLYDAHPAWGLLGRCVGHGGYPYFRDDFSHLPTIDAPYWRRMEARNLVPGAVLLDAPNPFVEENPERYGANGYVTLEFDEQRLNEVIHDADGRILRERQLA